mmetsp:Transcript_71439/g.221597  ORF Transcript_71439/g.221597 Transcript_71439/m.221597 type:complete len:232 (+) Transcript_71439:1783-2478(+)
MQRDDGVAAAKFAASPDDPVHLLFHLRVTALHRVEVQLRAAVAVRARGGGAAAHADAVGRAADLHDLHAHLGLGLLAVLGVHLPEAASEEDGLHPLAALAARRPQAEGAREAADQWLPELVAVVTGPVGAIDEDVNRRGHGGGICPAAVLIWLLVPGEVQGTHAIADGAGHVGCPCARALHVAKPATGARLGAGEGADACGHVVRLRGENEVHVNHLFHKAARLAGLLRGV